MFESDEFGVMGGYAAGYPINPDEEESALDAEFLTGPGWGDEFPEEVECPPRPEDGL